MGTIFMFAAETALMDAAWSALPRVCDRLRLPFQLTACADLNEIKTDDIAVTLKRVWLL